MSALNVTFVGSGDAFGSGGRLQTCILLTSEQTRCAVDFGTTSLVGLRRLSIDPNSIDTILLTHLHGDHCGGVPFLLIDAMLGARRTRPLEILGPPSTAEHMARLTEALFPGSAVMTPKFELTWREVEPGASLECDALNVTTVAARHTPATHPLAVRVALAGRSVAYTGDGELTAALTELVRDVDLLIAESYFYDKAVPWHLNYPDIRSLSAQRIVLTHMHSNMLAAADAVAEECAYDGMAIDL